MKPTFLVLFGLFVVVATLMLAINIRSDTRPEARVFSAGKTPLPAPDGSLAGNHFKGLGENWQGKQFYASKNSGINNFKSKTNPAATEQRYPFKTAIKQGLRNKNQKVLQLNYDVSGNPFWLRPIKDELVEIGPGRYQGKIHVKIAFIVMTVGYFELNK